jgi:hypothetical protein
LLPYGSKFCPEKNPWFSDVSWFTVPSGKLTLLWKITILDGKIHYKWPFSIAYVKLPEGIPIRGYK